MKVSIEDYGYNEDKGYVKYKISDLNLDKLKILNENLNEDTELKGNNLFLTMYYDKQFFPFESEESKVKLEDYVAREEIEMEIFLSSFLEDFN
ncbi:DUF5750 family protein [Methanobrevibacter sp. DSM 116169]|uniref:DUF5750 family protein n=1 Tax=Methanobrevibacter sp. DSM 116169 TaxID=3242727 RepID=UPI0038FCEF8E